MAGEFHYKDKDNLEYLVNKEFKRIDKIWHRDDQEILDAWCNIIESMINEIKRDKSMVYWERSLWPLINLHKKFVDEYNSLTWLQLLTNNTDKIYQVAKSIDNAERETLERLRQNRTVQDSRNIVSKSQEINNEAPMFVMEKNNGKDTWNIIFTKAANPVRIEQAVKWLFKDPNKAYIIDYSNCDTSTQKWKAIKEKMTSLIWANICYLWYDDEQKTYTIRDQSWKQISDRAYIWEWVKLIPDWVRQWHAYNEKKEMDKKIWSFDETRVENQVKNLLKDMPSAKKQLNIEQQKNLIRKTEYRINELLRKAKSLWYELEPEPITKKHTWKGHMELHLNSGSSEADWTFWERIGQIWEDLSQFIDDNEGEYKTYLTNRVWEKWRQMDELTETENVDVSDVWLDKIDDSDKINILKWIWRLEYMINNFIESEWDSWIDTDDRRLVQMKKILRNWRTSLENADNRWKNAIINNILDPFRNERSQFKWIPKTGTYNEGTHYSIQYNYLNDVFFWTPEKQRIAIREMWSFNRLSDKTETSFLAEDIETEVWTWWVETNDKDINQHIQNIENLFSFKNDEFDNVFTNISTKGHIRELYDAALLHTDDFIQFFVSKSMFPSNWESYSKDIVKLVYKQFVKLQTTLRNNLTQIDNLSIEDVEKEQHKERLRLEQKENKTEEDIKKLQWLIYLENNKEEQERINKESLEKTKEEIRFWNIDMLVKWTLFPVFAEMWGGAKWTNSDIYNDIKWIWNWNLSDENAKWVWEMVAEIAITVAIAVITGWAWAALMQWILRWTAKAVAKIWALAFLAPRIYRIAEVAYMWYRSLKRWGRAIKLAYSSVSLLAEGTIFNAVSTAVHSASNWTSFDGLNLNPIAQENIQTAAFLWALSIWNKFGMKILTELHWKTKIEAFSKAWLSNVLKNYKWIWTESLISEATAMFGAEQGMNFVFWHDVYNSVTWEIEKKRSLTWPTEQEWIQMIWMLLAFKMVKPQLRHDYAQKLNKWTLEICRWVRKNEVLLRDRNTWKLVNLHDLINRKTEINTELRDHIDSQHNNYGISAEQKQLREHNKWREKQSKYESEILQAQEKIWEMPEHLRSDAMKKLLESKDIVELSPEEIKEIQKEIWLKWKDVDWVFGPDSLKQLDDYINRKIEESILWEKRENLNTYEEKLEFLEKFFNIDWHTITKSDVEFLDKEKIIKLQQLKDLWFDVSALYIRYNYWNLTSEQISKLKTLKELWVNVTEDTWSLLNLTQEQINTLKALKELWVYLGLDTIELSEFTQKQINTLKTLKELWVDLSWDTIELSELTEEKINTLKISKELWLDIRYNAKDLSELTSTQLANLAKYKPRLEKLWLKIDDYNLKRISKFSESDMLNIERISPFMKDLWIWNESNIWQTINENFKITNNERNFLKKVKWTLDDFWIKINCNNIYDINSSLKWLTENEINNLKYMKDELEKMWINLWVKNVDLINKLKWFTERELTLLRSDNTKYYEWYNKSKEEINIANHYNRWDIIEDIQKYLQKSIGKNRDILPLEIIDQIRPKLIKLPTTEKLNILFGIHEVVNKYNTVRKYIDFNNWPYKTAKELLCAMRGITDPGIIAKITEDIKVIQYWTWLTFFVWEAYSYDIIYGKWKPSWESSAWFNSWNSEIIDLKWTLSVVKWPISIEIERVSKWIGTEQDMTLIERRLSWKDPYKKDWVEDWRTVIHEWQHNINRYFMGDRESYEQISWAKDEITAYLREWSTIEYIERILTQPKSEWWSYQYWLTWETWETHKAQVRELLKYAKDIIELTKNSKTWLTKDKIISMLSDAPATEWKDLHSCVAEVVKLHMEKGVSKSKINELREKFVKKIQERAGNNRLISDIMELWNSLFPSYWIHLEEFRWAWTAKKETVINEIKNCSTLHEFKYIIRDPKYSHIWRWANNLWWIEICKILDEVAANRLGRSFIPDELRPYTDKILKIKGNTYTNPFWKEITLTPTQSENVKRIEEGLWIKLNYLSLDNVKDIELTDAEIANMKILNDIMTSNWAKSVWKTWINELNLKQIKEKNFTDKQVNNLKKIKEELWINIDENNIDKFKDIPEEQINNLKKIKEELWINIDENNIDVIQHILNNIEISSLIKEYLETWNITTEWIDTDKIIQEINQEIEYIEKIIKNGWPDSNLRKIKNKLFYMKQSILWRDVSNLWRYGERVLATERQRSQTIVNEICKKYENLLNISENIVITEDCDLTIIEESLEYLNKLPKSTLQKIKDNWIMLFFTDKAPTELGFNLDHRWEDGGWWREWYTVDNIGAFCQWKIVSIWRSRDLEWKYISNTTEDWENPIIFHELWHAFDFCAWEISRTPEFIEFHKKFYNKITSYEQWWWPWEEAWCSEFFAESTAEFFKYWEERFKRYYSEEYYEYMKNILVSRFNLLK